MVTEATLRKFSLALPEATEEPHFEKSSFRVKKKIFATYDKKNNRACVKLTEADQYAFGLAAKGIVYPVPNKWGKQGFTFVEMKKIPARLFREILITSYCQVAPATLAKAVAEKFLR